MRTPSSLWAESPDPRGESLHLVFDELGHEGEGDVQHDGDADEVEAGADGEQGEAAAVAWINGGNDIWPYWCDILML